MYLSRRLALGALAAFPFAVHAEMRAARPDLVLYNGSIWTGSGDLPEAQAIAIAGDRIVYIGANEEVLAAAGPAARRIDLGWKRVTPGINDAHAHPTLTGVAHLRMVACDKTSIEEILADLRRRAAITPPGAWVLGFLYDDAKTPRPINVHDLDAAVPDHPVRIQHRGGHSNFLNSRALSLAGFRRDTPNPPGGIIERDSQCELTGKVADAAIMIVDRLTSFDPTDEDYRDGIREVSKIFTRNGITSVCDAGCSVHGFKGLQDARSAGMLGFRAYCHIWRTDFEPFLKSGVRTGFGDDMVRLGAVKLVADGSISERTAWLAEPYLDMGALTPRKVACTCCVSPFKTVSDSSFHGTAVMPREEMHELAGKAHSAGWQVATHCNGDLAIEEVVSLYEQLQAEVPSSNRRHRLEHCTLVDAALVKRIAAIGAVPIPFGGYVYFHGDIMHFYGKERAGRMFAMRSFLDAGLPVASSSDYGASPPVPMMWFQSQLTRRGADGHIWGDNQRINIEEALRCATRNGAYASFEEHAKGTLEPGKLADLAVWSGDCLATDPEKLLEIRCERTMLGGKWSYES